MPAYSSELHGTSKSRRHREQRPPTATQLTERVISSLRFIIYGQSEKKARRGSGSARWFSGSSPPTIPAGYLKMDHFGNKMDRARDCPRNARRKGKYLAYYQQVRSGVGIEERFKLGKMFYSGIVCGFGTQVCSRRVKKLIWAAKQSQETSRGCKPRLSNPFEFLDHTGFSQQLSRISP